MWVAFYEAGGEIHQIKSDEYLPHEVPCGIQGIAVQRLDSTSMSLVFSNDWYVYDEELLGGWCGMDREGLADYLIRVRKPVVLKMGRNISEKMWRDFIKDWQQNV